MEKHKKSLESRRKVEEDYLCNICNYNTSRKYCYNKHCLTAKHMKHAKVAENSSKVESNYNCELCNYTTDRKDNYASHCLTAKHIKQVKVADKVAHNYNCEICNYTTRRKNDYDKHILTAKHKKVDLVAESRIKIAENDDTLLKKLIINIIENQSKNQDTTNILTSNIVNITEKMTDIIKQNDSMNTITHSNNTNTNTNNNTNSNNTVNQKFNLHFYLNEHCKDALNITDFIESIKLTLQDLMQTAQLGYTDGITKIINDKIKETGEEKRPFHCTDIKREVVYVKDNNIWEKEPPEKPNITKLIDGVVTKNFQSLAEYKEVNSDCDDITCRKGEENFNIMCNLSGGNQSERDKKKEKIIKNILKETTIEKNIDVL